MHSKVHVGEPKVDQLDNEILCPAKAFQQTKKGRHENTGNRADRPTRRSSADFFLALQLDHDGIKLGEPR